MKDLFSFYQALIRGEEIVVQRCRSYREYVEWLQRQDLAAAEQYWREQLRGFRAATPLPVRAQQAEAGGGAVGRYAEVEVSLSETVTAQLKAMGRQRHVTLNTMVEGVWALLLSRYSREREVLFGITVSGRPAELAGVEQMVGLFINTLPLRVEVGGEQEVWSWLAECRRSRWRCRRMSTVRWWGAGLERSGARGASVRQHSGI